MRTTQKEIPAGWPRPEFAPSTIKRFHGFQFCCAKFVEGAWVLPREKPFQSLEKVIKFRVYLIVCKDNFFYQI